MFSYLVSKLSLNDEVILYTYNKNYNNVFYYEVVSSGTSSYSGENLLIPLEVETEKGYDDNSHKTIQYLKVWVEGKERYVAVDVDECYPKPTKTIDGTYKFDVSVTENDTRTYDAYVGKVCTYTVDSNGYYTIHSLLHGEDSDGATDHIDLTFDYEDDSFFNDKETNQAATDLEGEQIHLKKNTSKRYSLTDENGYSMIGTYGTSSLKYFMDIKEFAITSDTSIIIREIDTDEDGEIENTFTIYKGLDFPGTVESTLTNVQYIYENDGATKSRVNLVLLYAEVEGEIEFESNTSTKKSDIRIVKTASPVKVSEDEFRYAYELYNPNTGKIDEKVYGTTSKGTAASLASVEPFAAGTVIKLTTSGEVNDKKDPEGYIDAETNTNLVFIDDVDLSDEIIELHLVNEEDQDNFLIDGEFYNLYELDSNVSISVLKLEKQNDMSSGEISALTLEQLAAGKNDIKAYNTGVADKNDKLTTKYGEFVKAYITYSKKSSADYPTIDSIIVVVNPDEPEEFLKK